MTKRSESLGKLAEALSKAQGLMKPAKKDSINPHFKSAYADLASCWAAIREPLASNGLALVQTLGTDPAGVTVETTLLHTSGEFLSESTWLPVNQKTPQGYASSFSYARRYALSAMVGLSSEEDDDGNAASSTTVHYLPDENPRANTIEIAAVTSGEPVVPFGKLKGQAVSSLDTKSLKWYQASARAELLDASKARFHASTHAWLTAVEAEIAKRENSTA